MGVFLALLRRELGSYFFSLSGYVVLAASALLLGGSFAVMIHKLQAMPTSMPLTELFYITDFFWLILLLGAPAVTMRTFSLERYSGTFETLMTTPVGDLQVVLSKFAGAMVFYLALWLPLLCCILTMKHFNADPAAFDPGAVGTTFLGIMLIGGMFVAAGCCASALTRNQVVAAILSLLFGGCVYLLGIMARGVEGIPGFKAQLLAYFALPDHMQDFARGVVDTRPVVFLVTVTLFFLFLTLRIIESRRWK
jgi:ABC-2 type transport system permease protein